MSSKDATGLQIRWLIRRDLENVIGIDKASFNDNWPEDEFLNQLRKRNCVGMVVEGDDDSILGFMIYELQNDTVHLVRLAVAPDQRRRTVGTQMLNRLKDKLSQQRRTRLEIWLDEHNLNAQLFFRSGDFRCADIDDGMYLMRYSLKEEVGYVPKNRIARFL